MFQGWRIKLRAAEEAYRGGRFQEAGQLLNESDLREFLPAKQLLAMLDVMDQDFILNAVGDARSTSTSDCNMLFPSKEEAYTIPIRRPRPGPAGVGSGHGSLRRAKGL